MPCIIASQKTDTERLFAHLHRGGRFAHLWTDRGHRSYWFPVAEGAPLRRRVPRAWLAGNVYFSVNPSISIPPHNAAGGADPRYICSQLAYIAAINCLYAEYDGKDFVRAPECEPFLPSGSKSPSQRERRRLMRSVRERLFYRAPGHYKKRILRKLTELPFVPSVIVDSGGGYHCYWLLHTTVPVDEGNRGDVQAVQHGWVRMVGADPGASDLRRLLRVPGTYNRKVEFRREAPRVFFLRADFELTYAYDRLEEAVNDWLYETGYGRDDRPRPPHRSRIGHGIRAAFNRRHHIVDLLERWGYRRSSGSGIIVRMARPGRTRNRSSVTVFPAQTNGVPELSVHFSTNDELYSEMYIDEESGQIRRRAHDAFYIHVMLDHAGDWRAAYAAATLPLHTVR